MKEIQRYSLKTFLSKDDDGGLVKLEDVEELLASKSPNSHVAEIARLKKNGIYNDESFGFGWNKAIDTVIAQFRKPKPCAAYRQGSDCTVFDKKLNYYCGVQCDLSRTASDPPR